MSGYMKSTEVPQQEVNYVRTTHEQEELQPGIDYMTKRLNQVIDKRRDFLQAQFMELDHLLCEANERRKLLDRSPSADNNAARNYIIAGLRNYLGERRDHIEDKLAVLDDVTEFINEATMPGEELS